MHVRYLDGLTSVEHRADLAINPSGLTVHYVDQSGGLQEIFWSADDLLPAMVLEGRPIFLRHQSRPGAAIQFDNVADFSRVTTAYPYKSLISRSKVSSQFTGSATAGRILLAGSAALLLLAAIAFFTIDSFGGAIALLAPRSWDVKAGRALFKSLSSGDMDELPRASAIAQRFFRETGYQATFPIELHVAQTRVVNAFALPGGPIILNSGLILKANSPEELAGVLAHELGHVEERHTFQTLARMGLMYTIISTMVGDVSGIVAVIVENGQSLYNLSYGRKMESSADKFAVEEMKQARIDPQGLVRFFSILQKEESDHGASELPTMMMTHPATAERIAAIRQQILAGSPIDAARRERLAATLKELKAALAASNPPVDPENKQDY